MVNSMIKYKYLYNNYLEHLDQMRKDLEAALEIKVNKNTREIMFLNEDLQKANKAYIILGAVGAILLYPFYIFMNEYLYLWSILIYLSIFFVLFMIVFCVQMRLKLKIKELEEDSKSQENEEFKLKYTKEQEKIYDIALFIIVANENYDKLVSISGDSQKKLYEELKENRKNIIDISMNYKPNPEKYQRYLDEWIISREGSVEM